MSQTPARLARRKKERFLESLARNCNVTVSCEMAGLARETAYFWKRVDYAFSVAWDEALERGLDALEDEVMRRAKEGVEEPIFYQGGVVGTTRRYSDVLAMFLLKSKRRDVFGERREITANQNILSMSPEQRDRMVQQFLEDLRAIASSAPVIDAEATDVVEGNEEPIEGRVR
jgi:hypothetical protein